MKLFAMRYAVLGLALAALPAGAAEVHLEEESGTVYEVKAGNARMIRRIEGPIASSVQGVPAQPVDAFVLDGDPTGIEPLDDAQIELEIDPLANSGEIKASWTDQFGDWTFVRTAFMPPPHETGLRVGPSAGTTVSEPDDPVTTNVYLHGDTDSGGPVLPTLFNLLATWGPAAVTLDGQPFANPFDGPAPLWVGHTMTTVGARNPAGEVLARDMDGEVVVYGPTLADSGLVDNDDLEVHLVFHDAPGPMAAGNFPPGFSFFYHLQFEDVKLEIKHAEAAPE